MPSENIFYNDKRKYWSFFDETGTEYGTYANKHSAQDAYTMYTLYLNGQLPWQQRETIASQVLEDLIYAILLTTPSLTLSEITHHLIERALTQLEKKGIVTTSSREHFKTFRIKNSVA